MSRSGDDERGNELAFEALADSLTPGIFGGWPGVYPPLEKLRIVLHQYA
jgi:hypothetical protein